MPEVEVKMDTTKFMKGMVGLKRYVREVGKESMARVADLYVQKMKRRIRDSVPAGRIYYGEPYKGKRASAPFQPPAIILETLINAFYVRVSYSYRHIGVSAIIENIAPHASWMEYGTKKIIKRPFIFLASSSCSRCSNTSISHAHI